MSNDNKSEAAEPSGIEIAARWVDDRREQFEREHGMIDPETGSMEFRQIAQHEYDAELFEIAEGIRALSSTAPAVAEPKRTCDVQDCGLKRGGHCSGACHGVHPDGTPLAAPVGPTDMQILDIGRAKGMTWCLQQLVDQLNFIDAVRAAIAAPVKPTFTEAWQKFIDKGYRYGDDALENVKFGFDIANGKEP